MACTNVTSAVTVLVLIRARAVRSTNSHRRFCSRREKVGLADHRWGAMTPCTSHVPQLHGVPNYKRNTTLADSFREYSSSDKSAPPHDVPLRGSHRGLKFDQCSTNGPARVPDDYMSIVNIEYSLCREPLPSPYATNAESLSCGHGRDALCPAEESYGTRLGGLSQPS